jgi:thioredoxin 1
MAEFDTPITANDASFERAVVQAPRPVVAVFWSHPETARDQIQPLLERVAQRYAGEAMVVKLEASDAPQAHARYDVGSRPQFLFFREGKLIARAKGLPTLKALEPWMDYLLGRGERPVPKKSQGKRTEASSAQPLVVTDATFERDVLRADKPVLVDFWAAWCGPCRMVAPTVEALAQEFAGRAVVAKLDVDANQGTARRYGVQSIPTLIYFRDGQEVERVMGAQPAHVLRQKLAALVE